MFKLGGRAVLKGGCRNLLCQPCITISSKFIWFLFDNTKLEDALREIGETRETGGARKDRGHRADQADDLNEISPNKGKISSSQKFLQCHIILNSHIGLVTAF